MPSTLSSKLKRVIGLNRTIQHPNDVDWSAVNRIQTTANTLETLTDRELTQLAVDLRDRTFSDQMSFDDETTTTAIASVREAVRRVTGKSYFRVQLLAGLKLAQGFVAEMATGEGKTLTSAIPGFLHWLRHPNVHVATPNVYLAHRDYEELQPVYELLGMKVGLLPEKPDPTRTRAAYEADITYGAGYAFGFDFLRDELTRRQQPALQLGQSTMLALRGHSVTSHGFLQRGHHCSLIDEIDSVLLDEAMTPLILSIGHRQSSCDQALFRLARLLAESMEAGRHYIITQPPVRVALTDSGFDLADDVLSAPQKRFASEPIFTDSLRQGLKRPWHIYVENALQARHIMKPDVDYIIRDRAVHLVDQKTGRIFSDRSWRGGLHQAVEEAAGVPLSDEKSSAGRITRQSYYRLYGSLCGMTGTASGAETEFRKIYGLQTIRIPLNRATLRRALPDRCFSCTDAKMNAVVREVIEHHRINRPVLIGTRTIHDSERLSHLLTQAGVGHVVLNGKQDRDEAYIIAAAGKAGAVTVATNMAGRGTDIKLTPAAVDAGGLHVIGVERHESRRVDGQLAGRAARAGAPGSFRFFLSADDELIQHHASKLIRRWKRVANEHGEVTGNFQNHIEQAQVASEHAAFLQRELMMHQDQEMQQLLRSLCYRANEG